MTAKYTPFPPDLMPIVARIGQDRLFEFARVWRRYASKKGQRRFFIEQHRTWIAEAGCCTMQQAERLALAVLALVNDVDRYEFKTFAEPHAPGSTRLLCTRDASVDSLPEMDSVATSKSTQIPMVVDEQMIEVSQHLPASMKTLHRFRDSDINEGLRLLENGQPCMFNTVFTERTGRQDLNDCLSLNGAKSVQCLTRLGEAFRTTADDLATARPIWAKEFGIDILSDNLWKKISQDPVGYWSAFPNTDPRAIQYALMVGPAIKTGFSSLMSSLDRTVCGAQDLGISVKCRKTMRNSNVLRGPFVDGWGLVLDALVKYYTWATRKGIKSPGTPMLYQSSVETAVIALMGYQDSLKEYRELSEADEDLYLHGPNADMVLINQLVEACKVELGGKKLTNERVWSYARGFVALVEQHMHDTIPGIFAAGKALRQADKALRADNRAFDIFLTSATGRVVRVPLWEEVEEEDPMKPGKILMDNVEVHVFLPGMARPQLVKARVTPLRKTKSNLKTAAYGAQSLEADTRVYVQYNADYPIVPNHDNFRCPFRFIAETNRLISAGVEWTHTRVNPVRELCERAGIEAPCLGPPIDWENEVRGSIMTG